MLLFHETPLFGLEVSGLLCVTFHLCDQIEEVVRTSLPSPIPQSLVEVCCGKVVTQDLFPGQIEILDETCIF